jgi:heme a synthase
VATLLLVVPAWLGTLHQGTAVLVLTAALLALRRLRAAAVRRPEPASRPSPPAPSLASSGSGA